MGVDYWSSYYGWKQLPLPLLWTNTSLAFNPTICTSYRKNFEDKDGFGMIMSIDIVGKIAWIRWMGNLFLNPTSWKRYQTSWIDS